MDAIDCDKISGWAFANSGGYAYLDIYAPDLYTSGTGNMVKVATVKANTASRPDIRAAFGNNPNIPLDCGFVWAIPDTYKNGRQLTIKVVPVNDVSPIGNSPMTTSGNCDKPVTPGGTIGPWNPSLPPEVLQISQFYINMTNLGINFSDEERAVIADFNLYNDINLYVDQYGSKPTLIALPKDEGLEPVDLYGGLEPYPGPDPKSCDGCPIITDPSSGTGIYGIPVRSTYPDGSWGDLLYRIDKILFVSSLFPGVGALRAPSAIYKAATFRSSLAALRAKPNGLYDAHHIFPQKFKTWSIIRGISNIHDPRFGVWWEMSSHRTNAWAYNESWDQFIRSNPNASVQDITNFAKQLMNQYGFNIFWL